MKSLRESYPSVKLWKYAVLRYRRKYTKFQERAIELKLRDNWKRFRKMLDDFDYSKIKVAVDNSF